MKVHDVVDSFLAKWLKRKPPDREIAEAQQQLRELAAERPSLRSALLWVCEVLPDLDESSTARLNGTAPESIIARLREGIPVLHVERPATELNGRYAVDWKNCRTRWRRACAALTGEPAKVLCEIDIAIENLFLGCLDANNQSDSEIVGWLSRESFDHRSHSFPVAPSMLSALARFTFFSHLVALSQSCADQWRSVTWQRGYCPACGNWPLLAELRGLEQTRYLRCGWCASEWHVPRLFCPYCGNRDHNSLSTLHCEGEENRLRVAICGACSRYVKTVSTLSALSPTRLWIVDGLTLHLDVAASE